MILNAESEIAELFRRFAVSARGRSPAYEHLAATLADDDVILGFVASLPPEKRQPNLLLGAMRFLHGTVEDPDAFRELVVADGPQLASVMADRVTQTNEAGRCATLLPVLAQLPQPLALLEVGAAAGLCLLMDRYSYDYGHEGRVEPTGETEGWPVVLTCRAGGATPVPTRMVQIAWRAGLDLRPVDVDDPDQTRWLEALVWPGEEYRIPRLRAALELARRDRPRVVAGDLRTDMSALAGQAPRDATLVVFHTAVLGYLLDAEQRAQFARSVVDTGAVWIANEGPESIPGVGEETITACPPGAFLLAVNGHPTAWTDPHGAWIDWLPAVRPNGPFDSRLV